MNLSVSNIAWDESHDKEMYAFLRDNSIDGLEIAPTRVISNPYIVHFDAHNWAVNMLFNECLSIPSMQSILYGRSEQIFSTEEQRQTLINYLTKAMVFAKELNCRNLVFGCPKNRNITDIATDWPIAIEFFKKLGDIALQNNTILSMEANPAIYNTNFCNYTQEAIDLVKAVNSPGFKVNLDIGTMLCNNEALQLVEDNIELINHIHISEPNLKPIVVRDFHKDLFEILERKDYRKFVSLEMAKTDLQVVKQSIQYVSSLRKKIL